MRDSQRSRVYKAETVIDPTEEFSSIYDLEKYVKRLMKSSFIKEVAPDLIVWISDGRGRRCAGCHKKTRTISHLKFPRSQRNKKMVLHELAHAIINYIMDKKAHASHGIEFCAMYIRLVSRFIGREQAFKLKESFRANKVQYE